MSAIPAVPRTARSAQPPARRGRRQVRLAADDLAAIVELALGAREPRTRAALESIADRDGAGAAEVISGILERDPAPRAARASFVRVESPVTDAVEPVLSAEQRRRLGELDLRRGSIAFIGPAGAGKTTLARWLARGRGRPLATVDLGAREPLSALIGGVRSAANGGMTVLLHGAAHRSPGEVDAIVEALSTSTLVLVESVIASPEVRVDETVTIEAPSPGAIVAILRELQVDGEDAALRLIAGLSVGETPGALRKAVDSARRFSATTERTVTESLLAATLQRFATRSPRQRRELAVGVLATSGLSQRAVHEITGVSRDTLRRHAPRA